MTGPAALGIDVGSTNTKVVLVEVVDGDSDSGSGSGSGSGSANRSIVEHAGAGAPTPTDAHGLIRVVLDLVRRVLVNSDLRPVAVGIASMAETGVPVDADGAPLTDLLRWDGHRAGSEAEALTRVHGRAELFGATGVRPSAKVPLATWAWLRSHAPDVHRRMARWAGPADLLTLVLTGDLATDHTLAGRTMAYRLPAPGHPPATAFDAALLDAVGLVPEQMPRVVRPDAVAGRVVTTQGAAGSSGGAPAAAWVEARRAFIDAGLAPGTPVAVAGHDHAVGTWAGGVRAPGDSADSLGTAEAVLTILQTVPDPVRVAEAGMSWVRTVSGRHDALLAGSASAGAMLGWLREQLGASHLDDTLAEVLADLRRDPAPTGTLVLPYLSGRQSPSPDPAATIRVLPPAGGVRLARAVLEGVCLQARWMLSEQSALGGTPTRAHADGSSDALPDGVQLDRTGPLTVLGAALAIPAWMETKQRVATRRLRWVTSPEPVAAGAALLALTRAGLLGDTSTQLHQAPTLPLRWGTSAGVVDPAYERVYADFVAAALAAP